jgi:hypothetical protein
MSAHENDAPQQNPDAGLASDAGVGGALAHDATPAPADTQDAPVLHQNDASDEDRIAGIVAQTRADVGDQGLERVADVLVQRFTDAGLDVDADRTVALAAEITGV